MFRNILISIFFFFGPAVLMLILRNAVLLMLLYARNRQRRAREQDVIDITPVNQKRVPNWFYIGVVLISLACAVSVFIVLQYSPDAEQKQYVPAHTDSSGHIVPGHWKYPAEQANP